MLAYNFRLMGLPPAQGTKQIKIPINTSCADAKKIVRKEYRINEALVIQLVYKGHPISDADRFTQVIEKLKYDPVKDTITVITQQVGGI